MPGKIVSPAPVRSVRRPERNQAFHHPIDGMFIFRHMAGYSGVRQFHEGREEKAERFRILRFGNTENTSNVNGTSLQKLSEDQTGKLGIQKMCIRDSINSNSASRTAMCRTCDSSGELADLGRSCSGGPAFSAGLAPPTCFMGSFGDRSFRVRPFSCLLYTSRCV